MSEVINTNDSSFETDVMIRSQLGLVIVDFWADWCAPCRMLAPVLESVVAEFADRVTLVKAETEQNAQASQQFGVSGIPAVFAVLDGEVIDSFQGAMPEDAIRSWIQGCLSKLDLQEIEQKIEATPAEAEASLREMLECGGDDTTKVLLLRALHQQNKTEEVQAMLDELSKRGFLEPECEQIAASMNLSQAASADMDALRSAAESAPNDLNAQFALAEGLAGQQSYQDAFEICLRLVQEDRQATGEQARLLMLDAFKVLGDDSELTRDYRRRLSMVLY